MDVKITDINISFWRLVGLLVEVAFASTLAVAITIITALALSAFGYMLLAVLAGITGS